MAKKYKLPWMSKWLNRKELEAMSVARLEKIGRQYGVEIDKRFKKSSIIEQLLEVL